MRKSLWMIPVVLLFTALGSPSAHANTIACGSATCVTSGGYVTEIVGLTIDGTLYNVTFGAYDDTTFATNGEAGDAASDIVAALGTEGIVGASFYLTYYQFFGVDSGSGLLDLGQRYDVPPTSMWISGGTYPIATYDAIISSGDYGGGLFFAAFSPASVSTPEPGTFMLTLTGVGLLGLMVVMRKRKALGLAQAT